MIYQKDGCFVTFAGDSNTLVVPICKSGIDFGDWSGWNLLLSVKTSRDDTDEEAVIQKFTDTGITVNSDDEALVEMVPFDTVEQEDVTLYIDIRAEDIETGARHTVADYIWEIRKPVTKHTDASITIYTTQPGAGASVIVQTSPLTGATLANPDTTKDIHHEVTPAATIAALTWPLPAAANMIAGRVYSFASSEIVTALTVSFAGTIRGTTLSAAVADQLYAYLCISTTGDGIVRRVS